MVIIGRHDRFWPSTRVIFYSTTQNVWRVVHNDGPRTMGEESRPPILGLVDGQVFFLDSKVPVVRCFDLVLRDWIPLDVKGFTAEVGSCVRCFMENINSFIYWDLSKRAVVSILDLERLKWNEEATKGESPVFEHRYPLTCAHGSTVYIAWANANGETVLYLLCRRETRFYWSQPNARGLLPMFAPSCTLTYSSGRLFRFGLNVLGRLRENTLDIYCIKKAEWHRVRNDVCAEYSVQGKNPAASRHSTVALRHALIVFGGFSVRFEKVRILCARPQH